MFILYAYAYGDSWSRPRKAAVATSPLLPSPLFSGLQNGSYLLLKHNERANGANNIVGPHKSQAGTVGRRDWVQVPSSRTLLLTDWIADCGLPKRTRVLLYLQYLL